jgi:hypothetical protein
MGRDPDDEERERGRDPQRRIDAQQPSDTERGHRPPLQRERDDEPAEHEEHADGRGPGVDREVIARPFVRLVRERRRQFSERDRRREREDLDERLLLAELEHEPRKQDDDRGGAAGDVGPPDDALSLPGGLGRACCRHGSGYSVTNG